MANNYLQPVNDHFGFSNTKLDDVEDDIFLNNSRSRTPLSEQGAVGGTRLRSTNPFEEEPEDYQRQILEERRRQIEARSLESTQKSLGLLYETEEVGKATAEELAKQREQLERTAKQLDDINASLRFSQRHLNGLKSVFGGLKNYLSGNRDQQPPSNATPRSPSGSQISQSNDSSKLSNNMTNNRQTPKSTTEEYDNHPISRLRDDSSVQQQRMQLQQQRRNNPFEAQLEANLEEMCGNLSRLKGLATDLGQEIESQNELLDNMNYKIEDVDIKLSKQNKDIHKLLGKK